MKVIFCFPFIVLFLFGCQQTAVQHPPQCDTLYNNPMHHAVVAPSWVATGLICRRYNMSEFMTNPIDDSTGDFGVLEDLQRLQMAFTSVIADTGRRTLYHIQGAARHSKMVHFFGGFVRIDTARIYDRNYAFSKDTCDDYPKEEFKKFKSHQFEERNIEFTAVFALWEDSTQARSGIYKGTLKFSLSLDSNLRLQDNELYYEGALGCRNFTYEGTYTPYRNGTPVFVKWSPNTIDELWDNCSGGSVAWRPCCDDPDMIKAGWETIGECELADNPKLWWMKQRDELHNFKK